MKKPIQLSLLKSDLRFFGGALLKGKRKSLRPLSSKEPIHLVMRSVLAKGQYSFLRPQNKKAIENLIGAMGAKFNVKVYQVAIQGNHIHLVIKIAHRLTYRAFIKALSSKIAMHVMKAASFAEFLEQQSRGDGPQVSRGVIEKLASDSEAPQEEPKGFWELRPFSRVLYWGKDFKRCTGYLTQNTLEAIGFIVYIPRKNYYSKWLREAGPPRHVLLKT